MLDQGQVFSDFFAQKDNLVTTIDARIKVAFTFFALIINLLAATVYGPLAMTAFCWIVLLIIRIPLRILLLRFAMPLLLALVILCTQLFLYGDVTLFTIDLQVLTLTAYEEGLARGLLVMTRVLGGVSLILLLSMTTPTDRLLMAAGWFRMPKIFIELTLLVYRYIFVLLEEAGAIREAQQVRLGYRDWRSGMSSASVLAANLTLRAYDRSERVFEAMESRGYTGHMPVSYSEAFGKHDLMITILLSALLGCFGVIGLVAS